MLHCIITVREDCDFLSENALFCNGITQNVILLHDMMKNIAERDSTIVQVGLLKQHEVGFWDSEKITSRFQVYTKHDLFCMKSEFNAKLQRGDTVSIVEAGEVLLDENRDLLHTFRTVVNPEVHYKIINYRMSHDFAMDQEWVFLNTHSVKGGGRLRVSRHLDKLLYTEQHGRSVSYGKHLYGCEALTVPFIWGPCHASCPTRFSISSYAAVQSPDIIIMEPNISCLKNCLLPLIAINSLLREDPSFQTLFNKVRVINGNASLATNGELAFHQNDYFVNNILTNCEFLTNHHAVVFFENRQKFNDLFDRPAVLLTYQQDNALNYLYAEALYAGVPFIHNSKQVGVNVGYYYEDCDVNQMQSQLLKALREFKQGLYAANDGMLYSRYGDFLQNHSITNEKVQEVYLHSLRD